ncbi:MAG: T9SS type A sorting domain-containing protein [Bacteroidetes bacterium]|nr:T9SS type A sorting domain-containing protein [Bacteroidota bacterium]
MKKLKSIYSVLLLLVVRTVAYAQYNVGNDGGFSFSCVGSVGNEVPLPIELLRFEAICKQGSVYLTWATATEINNDYFTIEKCSDGINFKEVLNVKAAGNSSTIRDYTGVDENLLPETSYYRLKQTDFDGKYSYSHVIPIDFENNSIVNFSVYPNPINILAGENFSLTLSGLQADSSVLVVLYDVLGREYYSKIVLTDNKGSVKVAIGSSTTLPKGVYMIGAAGDNKLLSKKVMFE